MDPLETSGCPGLLRAILLVLAVWVAVERTGSAQIA